MNILGIILVLITFGVMFSAIIVKLVEMLLMGIILMIGDIIESISPKVHDKYYAKMIKKIDRM